MTVGEFSDQFFDERLAHLAQQVLTNNLILHQISEQCSFDTLKSLRLVSTWCHDATLATFKKNATVCLGPFQGWGRISIQEFMGRWETSLDNLSVKMFQNFRLEFASLPSDNLTDQDYHKNYQPCSEVNFWKTCGPNMKHLHLKHCKFDQKKLANVLCNLAPNLESLVIECEKKKVRAGVQTEDYSLLKIQSQLKVLHVWGRLPFPNWQFLKYFPNLKEIKLTNYTNDNLAQDLKTLRIEEQGNILNLECLDLIQTQQSVRGLAEARLPLKHLSICLDRDLREDDLRSVMLSQTATLQTLQLFRFPLPNWLPFSSSALHANFSCLKELHLWGSVVSSFNFLKWMPSLKILVVDLLCFDKRFDIYDHSRLGMKQPIKPFYDDMVLSSNILLETENFVHRNLESFQIDFAFNFESLKLLRQWMPNLKALRSIFNDTTLRQVCRQWPKLEKLKLLYGSEVNDEGITGITLGSIAGKEKRQPNLTDLKELKSFEMECYCDISTISDASAYQAFLSMPHLDHLRLCVSSEMTPSTDSLLKERIHNVKIFRNYGDHDHSHLSINCCQRVSFYFKNQELNER